MAFESAFLSMMPSTIKVSTRTGHSNYGEPTFAATTTNYRARIVDKPGFVRTANGETIEFTSVCWIASTGGTITVDDRVTMPGGTTPQIVAVERYPDQDGNHHVKLMLGH